jgi:drug/metabolite transporter (DMT)-like permease
MTLAAWLLLLAILVGDTGSHLCLKAASSRAAHVNGIQYWHAVLHDPLLWVGVACFGVLFLCWVAFLSLVPLGQGVLAGSITMAGVMLGGRIFFGERITPARATAISLIAFGVLLVGLGK